MPLYAAVLSSAVLNGLERSGRPFSTADEGFSDHVMAGAPPLAVWIHGRAFAVSGCSSDYVMATKDGRMILTDGKPTVDDDTGLISYEDQQGNKMQINRDDVSQIIKR